MDLNEQELTRRLTGKTIGGAVHFFPEVDSTNDAAFRLAMSGADEGTVVVADAQSGGKGRLKRRWQSPPGCNLYTSIVLRPPVKPAAASQITLVAGVALAEFISHYCPGDVNLKWPNDVLIRGKKVCGILTEMKTTGGDIEFIIAGIGVNLNMKRSAFDETLRQTATSLREEMGREISRLNFTVGMYDTLERFYDVFVREGFSPVRDIWLRYAAGLRKQVRVVFGSEVLEGEMVGLDGDGALLVQDWSMAIKRVIAGDASLGEG